MADEVLRYSPLGIRERVIHPNIVIDRPGVVAKTSPTPFGPLITYRKGYEDIPHVQTHERIHAGQMLLGQPCDLVTLGKSMLRGFDVNGSIVGRNTKYPEDEIPAYAFQSVGRQRPLQQLLFNRYLDQMNWINAQNAEPLEAAFPQQLLREYVRSHPAPLRNPKIIK